MIKLLIYAVIIVGLVIWFRRAGRNQSKWGINLNRVNCPVCQTQQPIMRVPKGRDQILWGGTTCPKCQTNLDKYGKIVSG